MNNFEDSNNVLLELSAYDFSKRPPAKNIDNPIWETIETALQCAFQNGGFVYVKVYSPKNSVIKELSMKAIQGKYRMIALTRSDDPKMQLLEWWEPSDSSFRGVVKMGDDEWDLRTVATDLTFAKSLFHEIYITGDLKSGVLQFRSQWEPKPRV